MPLSSGARIGVFEIVAKLGEGGMGEVYRARDTKLDRDVALKVLPELFTSDPERLARFEREAKVLASLNHPNIAQVYGFEGTAIAMELVDGLTLEEIIRSGPESGAPSPESPDRVQSPGSAGIPLDRALPIVRQIANALEAAHDQGIIHRDLKPANVKVREDGTVKVLDFGLAKAFAADAESAASGVSNSPTLTARSTQMGMILGTAAYMAPEQAKGRAVDRRADVWAFGVVFFEMLAGRRAFDGDDVSEVLASVLKMEPDWNALPADLPGPVRRLLRRCLEKDPKKRLRDVAEGMLQLDEGLASGSTSSMMMPAGLRAADAAVQREPAPLWRRALPIALTAVVTAAAALGIKGAMAPAPVALDPVRFEIAPDRVGRLNVTSSRRDLAISPDGKTLVYSSVSQAGPQALFVRQFDQVEVAPLRGADMAVAPFFSADGDWVGFVDSNDQSLLKKVSVLGGPALPICRVPTTVYGAAWTLDGTVILGVLGRALLQVSDAGGEPQPLTELDKEARDTDHLWPSVVPGTPLILFVVNGSGRTPLTAGQLAVVDRQSRKVVKLGITGTHPRYIPGGYIVYAVEDGSVRAIRFDAKQVSVSGNPVPVLDAVGVKTSGAANFDVSGTGALVYTGGGTGAASRTLAWVDRTGREVAVGAPARNYFYARVAPDGKRLSLDVRDQEEDIWIWDLARETMQRLTDKAGADQYGLWTPDAQRVVFSSAMSGHSDLFWHRPDGVGQPEQITDTVAEKLTPFPNAITRDGKQVILRATVNGKNDLFIVDIGGDRKVKALLATEHDERNAALSPDGRFMAFESDVSGKPEIYVRPFPDVNSRQWPVSTAGGSEAVWAPNGTELFYVATDGKLMAVPVERGRDLAFGKPAVLFDAEPYFFGGAGRNYDVAPDGKRFIMVKSPTTAAGGSVPMTVVLHWVDELRSRVK